MAPKPKTALVTGASEGIGLEICRVLAARGYELILVSRRAGRLQAVAAELTERHGVRCHVVAADLAQVGAAQALMAEVDQRGLRVDLLANNAGLLFNGDFLDTDLTAQEALLQVNVVAPTALAHLAAARMATQGGGHILNVASLAAWMALPGEAIYAASKAYVLSLSQALADETAAAGRGVVVSALCPSYTDTKMLDNPVQGKKLRIPRFLILSPAEVARQGVEACLSGRATCVPGLSNRLTAYLVQLFPRMWVTRLMGAVYRRAMV